MRDGWTRVAFGDVVQLSRERSNDPVADGFDRYVGLEHLDPGSLKVRRWGNTAEGTTFTNVFRPGHVLFGKRRAYQRKVAVAEFDGVCSGDIYVFEPADARLLPGLLAFICQSDRFFDHAIGTSAGSLSPRTSWDALSRFELQLPPPEEQMRVAEVLSAAAAATESMRSLRHHLEAVERAFLLDAFGPAPGSSPVGLEVMPLSRLAEIRTGLAKGRRPDSSTTTRPYLRVANVKDGALDLREIKDIVVDSDRVERYSLCDGDVLMTEGGDLDKLGRGTVWQGELPGCLHQNHVFAVRTDPKRLDPWYLAALVRSRYGRAYFLGCAKRTSNLASINKRQVGELPVPLSPPDEQQGWVAAYRSILRALSAVEKRIALMTVTCDRLLNELLRG